MFIRNFCLVSSPIFFQFRRNSTNNILARTIRGIYKQTSSHLHTSLKNDGKGDGKASVVLLVKPEQMAKNIPSDSVLGKSSHVGIDVLNQMFKGNGTKIWNKTEETLEENNLHLNYRETKNISDIEESDFVVIIDFNEIVNQLPKESPKMLLNYEPSLMDSKAHEKSYQRQFNKILTFLDKKENNSDLSTQKYCYPVKRPELKNLNSIPFANRKLCCLIATEKNNSHPGELLYLRKTIVEYFNDRHPEDFEVYGRGWDHFPNVNKGLVDSKDKKIQEFKFVLCPENMELDGYITEKLFDAFSNGVVPIWQGPSNADDYISKNCYIDLREFSSPESLYNYISNLTEEGWNVYRKNIKSYLKSEKSKCFTWKAFVTSFVQAILTPISLRVSQNSLLTK